MERNAILDTVIMIRKSYLSRQNLNRDVKKVSKPVMQLSEGRLFRPREEQVPKLEHRVCWKHCRAVQGRLVIDKIGEVA